MKLHLGEFSELLYFGNGLLVVTTCILFEPKVRSFQVNLILQGQKSLNFCVWLHSLLFKTIFSKASHYKGKMFFIGTFMISIPGDFSEILGLCSSNKTGTFDAHFKSFLLLSVLWSFNFSLIPPLLSTRRERRWKANESFLIVSSSGKWLSRRDWSYSGNSLALCFISFICIVSEMVLTVISLEVDYPAIGWPGMSLLLLFVCFVCAVSEHLHRGCLEVRHRDKM